MNLTAEVIAIVGRENIQIVNGLECLSVTGTVRFADAVISGRIQGNPDAARLVKEQAIAAGQISKRCN